MILLFDSGVGGLSVLGHIARALPGAPVVYVADTAGFPYGLKSEAELTARVPALLGRLVERYDPAIVVIPCNTASVIALGPVRAALDRPVVGTVPAIKPAALATRTGAIGVLGTLATVRQPYVDRLIAEFAADKQVFRHGSARLVEIAEAKLRGIEADLAEVAAELAALTRQAGGAAIDTVVLACTHFPLLADELAAAAPRLAFVDSGAGIARRVVHLAQGMTFAPAPGRAVFTARADDVAALGPALAARELRTVEYL